MSDISRGSLSESPAKGTLIEIARARAEVDHARHAFKSCGCGVCHGRLILARKQLAALEPPK